MHVHGVSETNMKMSDPSLIEPAAEAKVWRYMDLGKIGRMELPTRDWPDNLREKVSTTRRHRSYIGNPVRVHDVTAIQLQYVQDKLQDPKRTR